MPGAVLRQKLSTKFPLYKAFFHVLITQICEHMAHRAVLKLSEKYALTQIMVKAYFSAMFRL